MVVCAYHARYRVHNTQIKLQDTAVSAIEELEIGAGSAVLSQGAWVLGGCLLAFDSPSFSNFHQILRLYTVVHTRFDRRNNGHTASRMYTGHTWVDVRASHVLSLLQCDACKHRKIRCDKEDPCSNCRTTGAGTGNLFFCTFVSGFGG
jgi:hypothetical protein